MGVPDDSVIKNLPAMQETLETWVGSLSQEDPLEEGMATHSSTLAWKILCTEEPDRLYSPWGHKGLGTLELAYIHTHTHTHTHIYKSNRNSLFLFFFSVGSHSIVFFNFFTLITEEGFPISPCYSLELCIQMSVSFLFSFAFHFSSFTAICKASSDNHLAFLHFFSLGMVLITASCKMS